MAILLCNSNKQGTGNSGAKKVIFLQLVDFSTLEFSYPEKMNGGLEFSSRFSVYLFVFLSTSPAKLCIHMNPCVLLGWARLQQSLCLPF